MSILMGAELQAFAAGRFAAISSGFVEMPAGTFPMDCEVQYSGDRLAGEETVDAFLMCADDVPRVSYKEHVDSLAKQGLHWAMLGYSPAIKRERLIALADSEREFEALREKVPMRQLFPGAPEKPLFWDAVALYDLLTIVDLLKPYCSSHSCPPPPQTVDASWLEAVIYAETHECALPTVPQWAYALWLVERSEAGDLASRLHNVGTNVSRWMQNNGELKFLQGGRYCYGGRRAPLLVELEPDSRVSTIGLRLVHQPGRAADPTEQGRP